MLCQSTPEMINAPPIASRSKIQKNRPIFPPAWIVASNAVKTGIVSVMTEALEASDRLTPEVKPNWATTQPTIPKTIKLSNCCPRFPRSLEASTASVRRVKRSKKLKRTVARAFGRSVTVIGPSFRVAILAAEY